MSEGTYHRFGWTGHFMRRSLRYGRLWEHQLDISPHLQMDRVV